jgi:hypothetical protein
MKFTLQSLIITQTISNQLNDQIFHYHYYIAFDDYNDPQHSPEVKIAVDDIIPTITHNYDIIGTLPNIFNARPDWLKNGNDFIIRKK